MSVLNSVDLAAARTLLLSYLSNSDIDLIAEYSHTNLSELEKTKRVSDFESICRIGNAFADNYDYSDELINSIREKFEETEELTWKSFEATMDLAIGKFTDQDSIGLFLAIVNSIQVPVDELDDLLDLAAWYASCRLSPLVKSEGGWAAFSRILISEDDTEEEEMAETSTLPLNSNQSITMSQLEAVDMGSMIIIQEKSEQSQSSSFDDPEKTPVQSVISPVYSVQPDRDVISEEIELKDDVSAPIESDEGSGTFLAFNEHFEHRDVESISEQSSSERLSTSPVMLSPPESGTPVYISSQPESIDLDSNSSSLDASLINELIANLKENSQDAYIPGYCEDETESDPLAESIEERDDEELVFNRSNTVETIKPVNSYIPLRQPNENLESTEDYSPIPSSIVEEEVTDQSVQGIVMDEPQPEVVRPQVVDETYVVEIVKSKPNYLLLAGAAAISLAAIYLKNAR